MSEGGRRTSKWSSDIGRQMSGEGGCSSVAGHQLSENERMKAEGRGRWQKGGIFLPFTPHFSY